jgi:hypothetical protein
MQTIRRIRPRAKPFGRLAKAVLMGALLALYPIIVLCSGLMAWCMVTGLCCKALVELWKL